MPDLHSAPAAYADEETVDTDFVHHLVRGAELLQTGDPSQARGVLEKALRLQPKNERGQNLLALSYFKLGLFDRAEELYRTLIAEHPDDVALRINLGLVQLKTGRSDEAILSFSAALELQPTHTKSQNYLGLAYMQKKDFTRAKEWFNRAGNVPMRERVSAAMQSAPLSAVGEAGLAALEAKDLPFSPVEAGTSAQESTPLRAPGAWVVSRSETPESGDGGAQASTPEAVLPESPPEPTPRREGLSIPVQSLDLSAPDLTAFSAASRIETASTGTFTISPTMVVIEVKGDIFARVEGLVASFGQLAYTPEFKRFRGRITDKPFGEPGRRVMKVSGAGRIWIASDGRRFHSVEIGDEPAYFREEALFAFEESLLFENGRVPSKFGSDMHLVHLRNRGRALLTSKHRPRSVDVVKGEPCYVPLGVLLGWHGNIAPRVVALAEGGQEGDLPLAAVELTGEGRVLLDAAL